jgi:hypothetical protein
VAVSTDGAKPRALVVRVPNAEEEMYWFFDPPAEFAVITPE